MPEAELRRTLSSIQPGSTGGIMRGRTCTLVAASLFLICVPSRADFKYTQSGQFTNGVDKAKAAFDAQATEVTIYVKRASLRIDLPDVTYGIIDLQGQRDIEVDPKARTYSVVKFDDIRARDKAASQQFPSHIREDARLTVTSTGKTQTLLGQTAQDTNIGLQQNSAESLMVDSWIAPSVGGFNEVSGVYERVASAIRGTSDSSGTDGARFPAIHAIAELMMATEANANSDAVWPAVMSKGILDLCKIASTPDGLPLLQTYQEYIVRPGSPDKELGFEFTLKTTSFSSGSLDKQLFRIPPGYAESHKNLGDMWIVGISQ